MIAGLIPARGGSKSIPSKSIAPCLGRPLLHYTVGAARACPLLDRLFLSTDSDEIARVGSGLGVEVPFLRPSALAEDRTPMIGVLRHFLDWIAAEAGEPEAVVLLQPTSPLRRAADISAAVELFRERRPASVVSVVRVPHAFTPDSLLEMSADGALVPRSASLVADRHLKPAFYARNGPAVLVLAPETIRKGLLYDGTTLGSVMAARDSVDVDEPEDLALCELLLREQEASA